MGGGPGKRGQAAGLRPQLLRHAAKADEWYSIQPSSDAAVAPGMARVILSEGPYDADFVRTCTGLPLLIRSDSGKRLLARDLLGLDMPACRDAYLVCNGQCLAVDRAWAS